MLHFVPIPRIGGNTGPCANWTPAEGSHAGTAAELPPWVAFKTSATINSKRTAANANLFSRNLCIELKLLLFWDSGIHSTVLWDLSFSTNHNFRSTTTSQFWPHKVKFNPMSTTLA